MPYRKKKTFVRRKRRTTQKSIYPRKRGDTRGKLQSTAVIMMPRGKGPFPSALFTKFTYADRFQLASSTGSFASNVFNINSLYDPDASGVGHQPRGYDTLVGATGGNAPYNKYVVYGCKISIRFTSHSSSVSTGSIGLIVYPATSTPPSNSDDARETSNSIVKTINTLGAGSDSMKSISWYINIPGLRGMSKRDWINEHEGAAAYNANPVYLNKAMVFYEDEAGGTSSVYAHVMLTFYAKLSSLNELQES